MQNIMQTLVRHVMQEAVAKAMEKAAGVAAKRAAQKDGRDWRGNFHYVVSGYYVGLAMRYIGIPAVVFLILLAAGMWASGDDVYVRIIGMAAVFIVAICVTGKKMKMIVYWDGGIMFLDRMGNVIVQMPSTVVDQAVITGTKIVFTWDGVRYKIARNPQDNEKGVQEMLAFYGMEQP